MTAKGFSECVFTETSSGYKLAVVRPNHYGLMVIQISLCVGVYRNWLCWYAAAAPVQHTSPAACQSAGGSLATHYSRLEEAMGM